MGTHYVSYPSTFLPFYVATLLRWNVATPAYLLRCYVATLLRCLPCYVCQAATHYTEELVLLRGSTMHQYVTPTVLA